MAKILVTAENFAFGPIGKILPIANLLKKQGHELSFAGYGTSLQLAKKFPFTNIYSIDTDDEKNHKKLASVIKKNDYLLSSMDISSVKIAKKNKVPVIWVDCLFWFWNDLPGDILDVDLFIVESSLNNTKNKEKFSNKIKNFKLVGPIIGEVNIKERTKRVLISFGGAEAPYWYKVKKGTGYPYVMTEILSTMVDWSDFDTVTIATNEKISGVLAEEYKESPLNFQCIPYQNFLTELATSELLIVTPGLVTAEAAFYYKTPTLFLPASNNSQYVQLDKYRDLDLAPASVHLSDYMKKLEIDGIPPHESIQQVMEQLSEFADASDVKKKVGDKINELVQKRLEWSKLSVKNGEKFIDSLGGNGIEEAVKYIEELIS